MVTITTTCTGKEGSKPRLQVHRYIIRVSIFCHSQQFLIYIITHECTHLHAEQQIYINDSSTCISTLSSSRVHSLCSVLQLYMSIMHIHNDQVPNTATLPYVKDKLYAQGHVPKQITAGQWVEEIKSLASRTTLCICKTNARINVPYSEYATKNPISFAWLANVHTSIQLFPTPHTCTYTLY